jgi:hypothetical protein
VQACFKAIYSIAPLCGYLLVGELRRTSALRGMLDSDEANIAISVNVEYGVLIEITGFGYRRISKLDVQRVCVSEVANFHGANLRSKKAFCGLA